ncbi:MAG: helix-turn-helix domain-containing protein [Candidatus Omnitrophota bacterium]
MIKDKKENLQEFGNRLKQIRQKLNLNQSQFAKTLHLSTTAISEFENGKFGPGYDFFYNIMTEFHVNLKFLLFGEGPMFEDDRQPETEATGWIPETEDEKTFLFYIKKSRYVKYHVLSEFLRFKKQDEIFIEQDIQDVKKE